MTRRRNVAEVAPAVPASDGAGVRLFRAVGSPQRGPLDPFLLLDEMHSDDPNDYGAGFPDHPHRGFETVTYLIDGSLEHRDSRGHVGTIVAGGVQWMTAGRGIVHSEMPRQKDGLLWGFQLWVNLPAASKMREPRYQEYGPGEIPTRSLEGGGSLRVVAGRSADVEGVIRGIETNPLYLDVALPPHAPFEHAIPASHSAFCYVSQGSGEFGLGADGEGSGTPIAARHVAVLGAGDSLTARAGDNGARFLLIAGRPIGEPVAWHGPFVMNTREELVQAIEDFREGRLEAGGDGTCPPGPATRRPRRACAGG